MERKWNIFLLLTDSTVESNLVSMRGVKLTQRKYNNPSGLLHSHKWKIHIPKKVAKKVLVWRSRHDNIRLKDIDVIAS